MESGVSTLAADAMARITSRDTSGVVACGVERGPAGSDSRQQQLGTVEQPHEAVKASSAGHAAATGAPGTATAKTTAIVKRPLLIKKPKPPVLTMVFHPASQSLIYRFQPSHLTGSRLTSIRSSNR